MWRDLTGRENVLWFLKELERHGCRAEGRITKLDNLHTKLKLL